MAAVEVQWTLEYRGGQLNDVHVLEDTRSSHECLNDLQEEYQARALLAKSKRFFNKGTQRFSSAKATDQTKCHKCGKKELRHTKDFEAKYNKVKAKLALLSSSDSASKAASVKNKGLIAEAYEWDEGEVSSDDNEMVEVKVLMALAEENDVISKEGARNGKCVKISMRKCDIRKPIWYMDSGCSRHMTGVKSYLHKYVEQSGPKVVFRDDSTCTTEGYGSIKCNDIAFTKLAFVNGLKYNLISISQLCDAKDIVQFDEKRGTIFNSNKEVVMIVPRVRDVYVLDMTSSSQESCFFAKASKNFNWLWYKRLAYLNLKTINKIAKQNLVIGLPSLVYSKDKPSSSCEKGKHHRSDFKTKQTSSIKKCLYLLHMDLFGHVTPRNSILVNFCDEKGISQNLSSPYTPEQNSVVERKIKTLIEAARIMLSGSVFSKQYWTEAISEHSSSLKVVDTSVQDTIPIANPPLPIPLVVTLAPQDRWSQDKHIELVNIIDNSGAGMLTRTMAKELSAASTHECLFVDFLSEEEPKKVSKTLKRHGWVDAMQDELNQFAKNKV
uniref:Retrovirus-related Pol polyprotein from transposon TNT 1-94 n=1 Tax=Tanacetum cinerariifolium TaxID=118510 RepID=A0A6L2KU05_TANCI|nr:retrovirus-related Pol polyprotein from transposon TNT 1-94 [Tanacetum cinerariifolium]